MKIKHIITAGCSFGDAYTPWTWPHHLEAHTKSIDPNVTFDHRGMGHQGQELIQKKVTHAIMEALDSGLKPEEMGVTVSWSGNDRKTWYITNKDYINEIKKYWNESGGSMWHVQFCDLKNSKENVEIIHYDDDYGQYNVQYALENMLMLQNLCKLHGIPFYQQYYMKHTYADIEQNKDHEIINYLYKQLDTPNLVKPAIHEYVKPFGLTVSEIDVHPNAEGQEKYFNDILKPFLETKKFFD
jgi:hypothetical protein